SIPDDTTLFTLEAAESVMHDLVNAVILVTLIMLVFLHSWRNAFIVMIAVPISLISSFVGMMIFDYTLNMMTLLALSLVIGILVDDAIVVLENVYRHLEKGKTPVRATIDGVNEISVTVISTTLVLIVVFLPVALAQSMIAPILKPFSLVIVFSVLLSLVVAFTVVPLLTSRFSKIENLNSNTIANKLIIWFEKKVDAFGGFIHRILIFSLRRKALTLLITTVLFIGSIALIPAGFIGSEFVNQGDMARFIIQIELPKDATIKETNQVVRQVEQLISNKEEVTSIYSTIGSNNEFLSIQGGENKAEVMVRLVPKELREISSTVFASQVKKELTETIPGARFRTAVVSLIGGSDVSPIQIVVESANQDSLVHYAHIIKDIVEDVPGATDIRISFDEGNPEMMVDIDKEKMARHGLSMASVGPVLHTAFNGNTDAKFTEGLYDYDINIRLDEFDRNSMDDLSGVSFINPYGQSIKLSQFADIYEATGSSKLERYARIPSIMVESQVLGRPAGDVGDEIKERLAALNLPREVSFSYEGDMKYQADAFKSLGIAFIASIILVYLIMVALYESYIYPLVVLFSVPLSIIGALLALALARSTLSIFSLLGLIMLIGIVLKNAILIVDFANQLKKEGYRSLRAIIKATNLRLRPILMTSLSLIIGLLPLALAKGSAAEWKNGLAWVIIGGLTSSMLLTLVIIPVIFNITDTLRERISLKRKQ
ncbi:MAG: efflux RND transporter permease subunit, partial [Bacteroidales bacterium]|nr:efflux RND transporter permease subunit [Bacteroidales bacterium]